MGFDPQLDLTAAMDHSPIPQQDHRPPKMPEQVFEEGSDIQPREIAGTKMKIEGQSSPLGGHGQGADRRDSILFVEIVNERCFSFGSPGAGHVGDEQETGFIEEDQMGAKTLSVFFMGPAIPLPVGDGGFVSLEGPTLRFLTTPPQAYQEFPDVAGVIDRAPMPSNRLGDTL